MVFAVALGSRSRVDFQRAHIFYRNVPKTTLGVNVAKLIPLNITDEKKFKDVGELIKKLEVKRSYCLLSRVFKDVMTECETTT